MLRYKAVSAQERYRKTELILAHLYELIFNQLRLRAVYIFASL